MLGGNKKTYTYSWQLYDTETDCPTLVNLNEDELKAARKAARAIVEAYPTEVIAAMFDFDDTLVKITNLVSQQAPLKNPQLLLLILVWAYLAMKPNGFATPSIGIISSRSKRYDLDPSTSGLVSGMDFINFLRDRFGVKLPPELHYYQEDTAAALEKLVGAADEAKLGKNPAVAEVLWEIREANKANGIVNKDGTGRLAEMGRVATLLAVDDSLQQNNCYALLRNSSVRAIQATPPYQDDLNINYLLEIAKELALDSYAADVQQFPEKHTDDPEILRAIADAYSKAKTIALKATSQSLKDNPPKPEYIHPELEKLVSWMEDSPHKVFEVLRRFTNRPEVLRTIINTRDSTGMTLLGKAIVLLRTNDNSTSAQYENLNTLLTEFSGYLDFNQTFTIGKQTLTPLYYAIEKGSPVEVIRKILDFGCKVSSANSNDINVIWMALAQNLSSPYISPLLQKLHEEAPANFYGVLKKEIAEGRSILSEIFDRDLRGSLRTILSLLADSEKEDFIKSFGSKLDFMIKNSIGPLENPGKTDKDREKLLLVSWYCMRDLSLEQCAALCVSLRSYEELKLSNANNKEKTPVQSSNEVRYTKMLIGKLVEAIEALKTPMQNVVSLDDMPLAIKYQKNKSSGKRALAGTQEKIAKFVSDAHEPKDLLQRYAQLLLIYYGLCNQKSQQNPLLTQSECKILFEMICKTIVPGMLDIVAALTVKAGANGNSQMLEKLKTALVKFNNDMAIVKNAHEGTEQSRSLSPRGNRDEDRDKGKEKEREGTQAPVTVAPHASWVRPMSPTSDRRLDIPRRSDAPSSSYPTQ